MGSKNDDVTRGARNTSLGLGFRLVIDQFLLQRPPPVTHSSSYSLYLVAWNRGQTCSHFQNNETILCCERPDSFIVTGTSFVLLKATCSPNPNPRTSGLSLVGHLVLPHEPIHPLNLLDLIFF